MIEYPNRRIKCVTCPAASKSILLWKKVDSNSFLKYALKRFENYPFC